MDYNYHTHTILCSHATGTMEEYVLRAIEGGIKHMGFSDHAPFAYPDGHEAFYRVPLKEAASYIAEAHALRDKYADKIDIKVGFEMEYYPPYFDRMLREARELGAEYLILGHHHIGNGYPLIRSSYIGTNQNCGLELYTRTLIEGMHRGAFSYVAHPDIINFKGDESFHLEKMREICRASRELDLPLEINFLGIREHRPYPDDRFWKIAGEERCPVTFGMDAHDTASAYDQASFATALEMVKKFGLNYIGKPRIINIQNL